MKAKWFFVSKANLSSVTKGDFNSPKTNRSFSTIDDLSLYKINCLLINFKA